MLKKYFLILFLFFYPSFSQGNNLKKTLVGVSEKSHFIALGGLGVFCSAHIIEKVSGIWEKVKSSRKEMLSLMESGVLRSDKSVVSARNKHVFYVLLYSLLFAAKWSGFSIGVAGSILFIDRNIFGVFNKTVDKIMPGKINRKLKLTFHDKENNASLKFLLKFDDDIDRSTEKLINSLFNFYKKEYNLDCSGFANRFNKFLRSLANKGCLKETSMIQK